MDIDSTRIIICVGYDMPIYTITICFSILFLLLKATQKYKPATKASTFCHLLLKHSLMGTTTLGIWYY